MAPIVGVVSLNDRRKEGPVLNPIRKCWDGTAFSNRAMNWSKYIVRPSKGISMRPNPPATSSYAINREMAMTNTNRHDNLSRSMGEVTSMRTMTTSFGTFPQLHW